MSAVTLTFKIPSRDYFATRDNFQLTQALYTLASLVGHSLGTDLHRSGDCQKPFGRLRITVGEYLATPAAQRAG